MKPTADSAARSSRLELMGPNAPYLSLSVSASPAPDPEKMAAGFTAPIETVRVWQVMVNTDMDAPVGLTWENIGALPADYDAYLIGLPQGPVNLRQRAAVMLTPADAAAAKLSLAVGLPQYLASVLAPPLDKTQSYVYPNPGPDDATGLMTFRYNLAGQSNVTIKIFDAGGRAVAEIRELNKTGPVATTAWPVTNRHGQLIGSGVYIYIIEAIENGTGTKTKLIDKVAIVR